jgi:acyl carrier protein
MTYQMRWCYNRVNFHKGDDIKNAQYDQIFLELFLLEPAHLNSELTYQSITTWDSVGHMELISKIEIVFCISLEMDDVIDFSSYEEGKKILAKYGINFDKSE